MKTLQQILGYVTLTGLIQAIASGIPQVLPRPWWNIKRNVIGDSGRYTRVVGQRKLSKSTRYGSPALRREMLPVGVVDVKLLHTFEELPIPPLVMQQLRSYTNYDLQNMGIQEVSRQTREFAVLFQNFRTAVSLMGLAYGRLGFDAEGNLLPDSQYGSAAQTIDYLVPAGNKGNIGGIISTPWNNVNAPIIDHITAIKMRCVQNTGFRLKYALYGRSVISHIAMNNHVRDFMARNPSRNQVMMAYGELPDTLFDLTWIPMYEAFYEDHNGNVQQIWPDNLVVFVPEPDQGWWETLEGSYTVPTTINIIPDANAAMTSMKLVYGMFGYGLVTHNPPTVTCYYGDTFLPVIKNPLVVFQATVV